MSAPVEYMAASGRYVETAGYAVSVLQEIASGQSGHIAGETPAEYAQRHLDLMVADGRITIKEPQS